MARLEKNEQLLSERLADSGEWHIEMTSSAANASNILACIYSGSAILAEQSKLLCVKGEL